MYPGAHAVTRPDHPAVIMGRSGEVVSYRQLDDRSNQLARLWRERGLVPGDHVAIFSENQPRFFEVMWAALRSGLYVTTINSYLSAEEVGYILQDSGARSLITTSEKAEIAASALQHAPNVSLPLLIGDDDERRIEVARARAHRPLQVPAALRVPRRAPPAPHRQAVQEQAEGTGLGRPRARYLMSGNTP